MTTRNSGDRPALLQGTLDLLVQRTLLIGRHHGHGIALAIQHNSGQELLVDHGSLYPALHWLESRGWIRGNWGVSDKNRRARFYELTKVGRKQLTREVGEWSRSQVLCNGTRNSPLTSLIFKFWASAPA